jgi:hypothetical protein
MYKDFEYPQHTPTVFCRQFFTNNGEKRSSNLAFGIKASSRTNRSVGPDWQFGPPWTLADDTRQHVVSKYNVVRTSLIDNGTTPLQVGNGNFAFNVDNTGMQVFCLLP